MRTMHRDATDRSNPHLPCWFRMALCRRAKGRCGFLSRDLYSSFKCGRVYCETRHAQAMKSAKDSAQAHESGSLNRAKVLMSLQQREQDRRVRRALPLKPILRSERGGQLRKEQTEQADHSVSFRPKRSISEFHVSVAS